MKKQPRKNKQWSQEAFQALQHALEFHKQKYEAPSDLEKLELVTYAPAFVAMNRGVKDKKKIRDSQISAYGSIRNVMDHMTKVGQPVDHCFLFLTSYLNTHMYYGHITQSKAEAILEYISKNYDESLSI